MAKLPLTKEMILNSAEEVLLLWHIPSCLNPCTAYIELVHKKAPTTLYLQRFVGAM
ncbi:hypothetical protein [Clostridium saccharoperbutylacetonicum]|uniref:hypothetical protein n=1 Tax=Clostridium saccharoperbutylacetonicum TaxID=36745 RepID=UPI0039EA3B81